MHSHDGSLAVLGGTATGTIFSLFGSIHAEDYVKTMILAIVGAVVSYCVSYLLRKYVKERKK